MSIDMAEQQKRDPLGPGFGGMFTPKLVTVLREGYGFHKFQADLMAGLTVAIVALPLSMAIAIASGVTPDRGLFTAIVGGFIVSLLGGSRFQIGGPAGAFIVLVAATVERHGVDGLMMAVLLSGLFLLAIGYLRLGSYIKFIPYPVTVGFTAGIAVIIFASQLRDLFGLTLAGREPGELIEKLDALASAAPTVNWAAVVLSFLTIAVILGIRRWKPSYPGMLIAVCLASFAAVLFSLPVETIGTRFGGIPRTLPIPALPPFSVEKLWAVLPDAISFALLGAIESLLSAVVADGMTGRRHRSNCELVAQGFANIGSALFGGISVTGTIARTATNVRAGAYSPVSGIMHAVFILLFMLIAAPLARYIPLAALAGVLAVVAWNMIERPAIVALLRSSRGDVVVLLVTFLLVTFVGLTEGILVGLVLGSILFIDRMAKTVAVEETFGELSADDVPDGTNGDDKAYDAELASDPETIVYRIRGAFFFGAASSVGAVLDRAGGYRTVILDISAVPFLDSTAANALELAALKTQQAGGELYISGATPHVRHLLRAHGLKPPHVHYASSIAAARAAARKPVSSTRREDKT